MRFPPEVVAHLDRKRGLLSLDPNRDVSDDPYFRYRIALAEDQCDALVRELDYFSHEGASVLDIGCGLALVDILLWRRFALSSIYLLDGDGTGEPSSGFRAGTMAWADVKLGEAMVLANVAPGTVSVHPLVARLPDVLPKVDVVMSLRSWGHHYPIAVYLEQVKATGAWLVITDIRNRTDGVEVLAGAGFHLSCRVMDPSRKCQRLIFRRSGW